MAKKGSKALYALLLVAVAVVGCVLANQFLVPFIKKQMGQRALRQRIYDEAWAKANGYDWQGNYNKDTTWAGTAHGKYHNLHENQIYDKNTGSMTKGPAITGFRPQASLLSQPFANAFAHAASNFAAPMPTGAEIGDASPFAAVPEGHQPWTESELPMRKEKLYAGTPSRWAGQASSPETKMFDTYSDNFDYDKSTGVMTNAPVKRLTDPAEYGSKDVKSRSAAQQQALDNMSEAEKAAMGAGVAEIGAGGQPWDENFVQ